jgi:outer membrane receptor protein involved in Fe transport
MKRLILNLILLLGTLSCFAQTFMITGKVIDGNNLKPFEFVDITIYDASGSNVITGGFSDIDGEFSIDVNKGSYVLKASFMGYKTYEKAFTTGSEQEIKLGRIVLREDTKRLEEVQVVGQKSGMTLEIDKKVFNVDQTIVADGASATELLENIPSVEVDSDGGVSLRNNSNVEIWINGKPSGLSGSDVGQVLEMIPAESIEKVELITNPSAKYSPEGTVGIINLVLKENRKGGYFGSVSLGANYREGNPYPGGNVGLNFNYSDSKWDVFLNVSARHNVRHNENYNKRTSWTAEGDTTHLNQYNHRKNMFSNVFARTGFTYHIDSINDFGISAMGAFGMNKSNNQIIYSHLNQALDTTQNRVRTTENGGYMGFYNASADYKHIFKRDKEEITANFSYYGGLGSNDNAYHNWNKTGETITENTDYQTSNNSYNSYSVQADYYNKFTKDSKLEVGVKAEYSEDKKLDCNFNENKEEILEERNDFKYSKQVYAAYATYGNKWSWFGMQLGLRAEETLTSANGIKRDYFDLFPSAYFSFQLPKDNELQLNYTRRIYRPGGWIVNNHVDRTDPTNIRKGNPYINPEYSNNLEFNYLKTWEYHTISLGAFYTYTEDVIQQIQKLSEGGVMETTFGNITYSQSAGLDLTVKNRLFNNYLDLTTTATAYYYQLGENTEYNIPKTETFSWNVRLNANVKIINNLSAQVTGYYNSPRLVAQGSVGHRYGMDLGIKASFLEKALNLSFSVRDVLNSRSKSMSETWGDNFHQENGNISSGRSYRLTLSYNFGNMGRKRPQKGGQGMEQGGGMGGMEGGMGDMGGDMMGGF